MKKLIYHSIWILLLLSINLCALPISIYSLFILERGTNITTIDYTLAIFVLIASNFITFQLFFAIKKYKKQNVVLGMIVGLTQLIAFILFMHLYVMTGVILFFLSIIAAVILIIKTWQNKNPANI